MGFPSRWADHPYRYGASASHQVLCPPTPTPYLTTTPIATAGGNMIAIENANDFEFYSANSAGGMQGHGYQCCNAG